MTCRFEFISTNTDPPLGKVVRKDSLIRRADNPHCLCVVFEKLNIIEQPSLKTLVVPFTSIIPSRKFSMATSFVPTLRMPSQQPVGVVYRDNRVFTGYRKDDETRSRPYLIYLFGIRFFDNNQTILVKFGPAGQDTLYEDVMETFLETHTIMEPPL